LQANDTSIWIDAGSGTLAELQRHVALSDVDAIWISHVPSDHWADLLAAWNAYTNANDEDLPRPTVFGRRAGLVGSAPRSARQVRGPKVFDGANWTTD
jgi:ribonuclease BN (tRNA processing enzyme)